jgi:hypothetical protein
MQLVMDDHLQMIQAARKIDVQNVSVLVDLSLHEIADHLFGGDYDAGSKRGSVALGVKLNVADSARSPIRLIGWISRFITAPITGVACLCPANRRLYFIL